LFDTGKFECRRHCLGLGVLVEIHSAFIRVSVMNMLKCILYSPGKCPIMALS
jgi:hypothetical protein